MSGTGQRLGAAYRGCYSRRGFLKLGAALLGAGAFAYAGGDEAVDDWVRERARTPSTDRAARTFKPAGDRPWFLVWGLCALADARWVSHPLTRWGRRNFESMLVGLPLLWTMQYGLGGARPGDLADGRGPRWGGPGRGEHSASGHAFMGAVPWLTAAQAAGAPVPRALAYLGSVLTGWSRLNDRSHYLSQVWLGWFAAALAAAAVHDASASPAAPARTPAPDGPGPADEPSQR